MGHTNAAGYALFEVDTMSRAFVRRACRGVSIPEPGSNVAGVESFHLRSGDSLIGVLVFTFSPNGVTPEKRLILKRTAYIIEALLNLFRAAGVQARLAARIGELEADLADEKIAERVGGLLQSGDPDGDPIDVVERHVHKVLETRHLSRILEDLLRNLEDRIAERTLMAHAKTLLQNRNGMSEQQAYIHLRTASRRNRKRMGDVARQVIEEQ